MKKNGFTLIEVLITVVIMAMALLGLAGLQTNALRNNFSAEQRGKAAQLVYDMSDRMRSNLSALASYPPGTGGAATANCTAIPVVGCSPAQMAAQDILNWQTDISSELPNGQGSISVSGAIYTITVNWDDNRDGNVDASDAPFTASFQP